MKFGWQWQVLKCKEWANVAEKVGEAEERDVTVTVLHFQFQAIFNYRF